MSAKEKKKHQINELIDLTFKQPEVLRMIYSTIPSNNTSGCRGVTWHRCSGKWMARIQVKGKTISLGYYDDINHAIAARKIAEMRFFSEYFKS